MKDENETEERRRKLRHEAMLDRTEELVEAARACGPYRPSEEIEVWASYASEGIKVCIEQDKALVCIRTFDELQSVIDTLTEIREELAQ